MKKITLFIGMVVIMATSSMAQIVNIPDANFKTALLAIGGLDANSDEEIQCSETLTLTGTLNVSNKSISNLTGIEAFTNNKGYHY